MFRLTRTPFRISFLGGGSDYPQWYQNHIGMVLGASINRYCYITYQSDQDKFRLLYSKIEECKTLEEIQHPAIKATLRYTGMDTPSSIYHACDLASRSGIGSSSAFVVGLLAATKGGCWSCLAKDATKIEQEVLKEPVGSQDQILCAKGGINQIVWHKTGEVGIRGLELSPERLKEFRSHLTLFYTHPRPSTTPEPLRFDVDNTRRLATMAKEGTDLLLDETRDIREFGGLLAEGWELKKRMSGNITTPEIDRIYQDARSLGAIGGKLLGSGEGGYMVLFAPPMFQNQIRKLGLKEVEGWDFEFEGCKVVYEG